MNPRRTEEGPGLRWSAGNWLRLAFALVVLTLVPTAVMGWPNPRVPSLYQHTGWGLRLLLTLPASLLCGVVLWPPIWFITKGSQARFMAATYAVLYVPVQAFLWVGYVNVALDGGPGRTTVVRFVRHEARNKGPSLEIVTSWRDPSDTIALTDTFLRSEHRIPGAPISLTIHDGFLGLEWVDEVRPVRRVESSTP